MGYSELKMWAFAMGVIIGEYIVLSLYGWAR